MRHAMEATPEPVKSRQHCSPATEPPRFYLTNLEAAPRETTRTSVHMEVLGSQCLPGRHGSQGAGGQMPRASARGPSSATQRSVGGHGWRQLPGRRSGANSSNVSFYLTTHAELRDAPVMS